MRSQPVVGFVVHLLFLAVVRSHSMVSFKSLSALAWLQPPPVPRLSPRVQLSRRSIPLLVRGDCSSRSRSNLFCMSTEKAGDFPSPPKVKDTSLSRDLHVYLFCTIVGWGKNVFLDTLSTMGENDLETRLGGVPTVLESDVIGGKKFWSAVERTIKSQTLGAHLFLNKNFPSNSWEGAKRKLEQFCSSNNRTLILHAIVPKSPGTDRNAFALLDLAVCLAGVQGRSGHPNLDSSSDYAAAVAASFYSFYNHPGGRAGFLESLAATLTDNVIVLEWMDEEMYAVCPRKIDKKMIELLRRARACKNTRDPSTDGLRKELEEDIRAFQAQKDVQAFVAKCRLPKERITRSFLSQVETRTG